ncbi:MAG: QueT transporter family protein, partial [Thaumarchaeota archaeon]
MNVKALLIAETLIFAALYFALTFILAPISFLPLQVRVSDSLIMLSAVLGLPVVYGVFLGCILANLFPVGYPPNPVDVVFGSLANLIASYL